MESKMADKKHLIIISVIASVAVALIAVGLVFLIPLFNPDEGPLSSGAPSSSSETSTPSEIPAGPAEPEGGLTLTTPTESSVTVTTQNYTFAGTADPAFPLTVNGTAIAVDQNGIWTYDVTLNVGNNTFTFEHNGESLTYTVNYRYVVLLGFAPSAKQSFTSGATFSVTATAREGSVVTARFNGKTITLTKVKEEDRNDGFAIYTGSFTLPDNNVHDMNLGKITFTAKYGSNTETFSSQDIICLKPSIVVDYDPNATPLGGKYQNVGSGKIAEIIDYQAETFDAGSTNDMSRPTNNYLPKGTVDYSSQKYYYYSNQKQYALLRCGYQVYTSRKDIPGNSKITVIKEYVGTLPDHNEVGIAGFGNGNRHTVLTMDVDWKAPFYFDILPQSYNNPKYQDYSISQPTFNYVDITFCYATVFEGELPDFSNNPIFSHGQIIKNKSDYTLRLYLRKQGGFYGWNSYYNDKDQLVFEFLNPHQVATAQNSYGADLKGAVVLIDVGHGGVDIGAPGLSPKYYNEANQNLALANSLKAELEAIGATVHLTRTTNVTSTNNTKLTMLRELKPDICIAIHHNSFNLSYVNGYESRYFHPFSANAAKYVYNHTMNTGLYKSGKYGFHYYYTCRSTSCPVVLTENGYISNSFDYQHIVNADSIKTKSVAITKGIVEYFISIKSADIPSVPDTPEPPVSSEPDVPSEPPVSSEPPVTSEPPASSDETDSDPSDVTS